MEEFIVSTEDSKITGSIITDPVILESELQDAPELTVIVGGVERVLGGWSQHKIDTRHWRSKSSGIKPGSLYTGRTYIYSDDVVNSLNTETWEHPGILKSAILHLAHELGELEDKLCEPSDDGIWECGALRCNVKVNSKNEPNCATEDLTITIPKITSSDLRAAANNPDIGADPETMRDLADAVLELAGSYGEILMPMPAIEGLINFPDQPIEVANDEAVLQLESSVAPHMATLEEYQVVLARRINEAAKVIHTVLENVKRDNQLENK